MTELKKRIRELLARQLFVPTSTQELILSQLDSFDEAKLRSILEILEQGDAAQNQVVEAALERNPNLFTEIQGEISHAQIEAIHSQEAKVAQGEEAKVLQELEAELITID